MARRVLVRSVLRQNGGREWCGGVRSRGVTSVGEVVVQGVLDPAALSARAARELVRRVLTEGGRTRWVDNAELATSELVTNAVLHAHTPVELTVRLDGEFLRVEVRDFSPILLDTHGGGSEATTGRGMALVASLASDHGVDYLGAEGKVVWFTISDTTSSAGATPDKSWDLGPLPQGGGHEVLLLDFPLALWSAAREHHDAILRELTFYRTTHPDLPVTEEAQRQADLARRSISLAADQAHEGGAPPDEATDLPVTIPDEALAGFVTLQDVLDEADRLAASGALLVRPALEEVVGLRDWVCDQVTAQLAGAPPAPWPGSAEFTPAASGRLRRRGRPPRWRAARPT